MPKIPSIISATVATIVMIVAFSGTQAMPAPTSAKVSDTADPLKAVSGLWYTEGREGGVELYPCGDEICGRLYWLNDAADDNISRDERNPDPDLRERPLCHLQFIGGFKPTEDYHYNNGWIYSPRHGAEFNAHMTLLNHDTLKVRGYLFFPALGQSQIWKRATNMPGCSAE
jgi:uncharacterized protein (DUF2147 family)